MSTLRLLHSQTKIFQDHFSAHASDYARYRPRYPSELFQFLAELCTNHERAWDCATGNGQAAIALTEHFEQVLATDASSEQIAAAHIHPNVRYSVNRAEASTFDEASLDLVTVAQALHWFDIEAFFAEVARVLKPGGILGVWLYEQCTTSTAIDPILQSIFFEVENFWPPERVLVKNLYRDILLPWPETEVPRFAMNEEWTVDQLLCYCRTWSASKRYLKHSGRDPVAEYESDLRHAWGEESRMVSWPLTVRVARR